MSDESDWYGYVEGLWDHDVCPDCGADLCCGDFCECIDYDYY